MEHWTRCDWTNVFGRIRGSSRDGCCSVEGRSWIGWREALQSSSPHSSSVRMAMFSESAGTSALYLLISGSDRSWSVRPDTQVSQKVFCDQKMFRTLFPPLFLALSTWSDLITWVYLTPGLSTAAINHSTLLQLTLTSKFLVKNYHTHDSAKTVHHSENTKVPWHGPSDIIIVNQSSIFYKSKYVVLWFTLQLVGLVHCLSLFNKDLLWEKLMGTIVEEASPQEKWAGTVAHYNNNNNTDHLWPQF